MTLTGGFIDEGAPANPGITDIIRLIEHTGGCYKIGVYVGKGE